LFYRINERQREFHRIHDSGEAHHLLEELQHHCFKRVVPPEIQKFGRTIRRWFDKMCNHHIAKLSDEPIEVLDNLIP